MSDADRFASASDVYSIVVAGAMNPAIHHPLWYRDIGVLNEAEVASTGIGLLGAGRAPEQSSLGANLPICSPAASQFTAANVRVACIAQSWTIVTTDRSNLSRIRDIAAAVFGKLYHTPVSAFGLNFAHHRKTDVPDVAAFLAAIVEAAPFGFRPQRNGTRAGKVVYIYSTPGRRMTISVEQSMRGTDMVYIAVNAHHPIEVPASGGSGQFDLTLSSAKLFG